MGDRLAAVGPPLNADFWRGRRIFLTGHTGFIGGWTAAVLKALDADVFGYALAPTTSPSFHALTKLDHRMPGSIADVRDRGRLERAYDEARPDIVLHLAAQPLVGVGYSNPLETFDVNVMGTLNVLECVRRCGAAAAVVMTSDKVYRGAAAAPDEDDRIGADDPYGGSKVCCEIVCAAYARSYLVQARIGLATVRAGNVIGGGDWADNRLIPDAVRAFSTGRALSLRRPNAVRPWQHVLDAVVGLLLVAQDAAQNSGPARAWNVGPPAGRSMTVDEIAALAARAWGKDARIVHDGAPAFPETELLAIDSRRIRKELGFAEAWDLPQLIARTIEWYREALGGGDAWDLTRRQIEQYLAASARDAAIVGRH